MPGPWIDLQLNGAFGVDLNQSDLDLESFERLCHQLSAIGMESFLPTIITDRLDAMCDKIRRIASYCDQSSDCSKRIGGIHIEGPFLSTTDGFYGTHPREHLATATVEACGRLLDAGRGLVRLMTLAPEQDPSGEVTRWLIDQKVAVFAGHTDASLTQLRRSIDCGLSGFTHLGNGCARQVDRQDNIIQRVLSLKHALWITLIADTIHVPLWLLHSWLEWLGTDRTILVSDAIAAAGMPPGKYSIGSQTIEVTQDRRTINLRHGYLAGSATNLDRMDELLRDDLHLDASVRRRLLYENAKRFLATSGLPKTHTGSSAV